MRFTNDHKNFKDAMEIIFDLYQYLIKTTEDSYYNDDVILLVAKLCHKTIPNFSPCIYHSDPSFYFDYKDNQAGIRLKINSHLHEDNRSGLKDFVNIMNAFHNDINSNRYNLLSINEIVRETHGQRILKNSGYIDWIKKVNSQKKDRGDYNWLRYDRQVKDRYNRDYIKGDPICDIRHYVVPKRKTKPTPEKIQEAWRGYEERLKLTQSTDPPFLYESISVTYNTASQFFKSLNLQSPDEKILSQSSGGTYFIDHIKYIFATYIALFGSFDRIKICRNCGHFFYQKKYGYGIFCNTRCRVNFHVASEPKNILLCRARQNRWLDRKLRIPDTIKKDDCKKCRKWKSKGGKCEKVQEKNEKKLNALKDQTKFRHTT